MIGKNGKIGHLCPGWQTPAENAEAEINLATLEYSVTADGRIGGIATKLGLVKWDANAA